MKLLEILRQFRDRKREMILLKKWDKKNYGKNQRIKNGNMIWTMEKIDTAKHWMLGDCCRLDEIISSGAKQERNQSDVRFGTISEGKEKI